MNPFRRAPWRSHLLRPTLLVGLLLALASSPGAAPAARADDAPLGATAGYEYYAGPDHQLTRTIALEVEGHLHGASASLAAGRFDDQDGGVGLSLGGSLALPVAPRTALKLEAERARGDSSYRTWTFKAGPTLRLPAGPTLALAYVHVAGDQDESSNGATAGVEVPLVPDHLTASGAVSYARVQDLGGLEGTAGLSWSPLDHVELEVEGGYTQTGIDLQSVLPTRHIVNRGRQKKQGAAGVADGPSLAASPGATVQLAVRISLP